MVTRSSLKEVIEVLGIFLMFALSIFTYLVWWLAFANGGRIWVDVTLFGERWVEYFLWLVITPVITLALFYYLKGENRARG